MHVAFWASVPLFAVYLAGCWLLGAGDLGWPGRVLWSVVVISSGFLTARLGLEEPGPAGSFGRTSEQLVYPVVFYLAVFLYAAQLGFF
jgi:hypothetical protein